MLVLAAVVLALVRPPTAYLDTGTVHVPLTISSWCWRARCGAPIAAARHIAYVRHGATVRAELAFVPTQVHLSIGSATIHPLVRGHEVSWPVKRGGSVTLTATGLHGFVTYVGRLAFRS